LRTVIGKTRNGEIKMESEMKTKTKKGVTLLVEALKNEGVEVLFGYPGGAVLHIYDEFYKSESNHVLTRH
jgi:glyoxylate carboligase